MTPQERNLLTGIALLVCGVLLLVAGVVHDLLRWLVYASALVAVVAGVIVLVGKEPSRRNLGIGLLVAGLLLLLVPNLAQAIAVLAAIAGAVILILAGIVVLARVRA
jgi:hypothetical protein